MSGVIHRAVEANALELLQLEAQFFDNALTEDGIVRELQAGEGFVWRQFDDPTAPILGYILVRDDGHLLDITRLGVVAEARCLGIGTALLKKVLDRGRTTVLTVRKDNTNALKLYKAHGFTVVGHFVHEGIRAWVLRRDAPPSGHPAV
jgi:ribosomal protein S18 acetylase RimI-like enzyme